MPLVDLSHPMTPGMPVYPGDPTVAFAPAATLADEGANVSALRFGSHTGTHLDAPSHMVAGGRTVDQLNLAALQGTAYVLHTRSNETAALRDQPLGLSDVAPMPAQLPTIVCIATGWDRHFHEPVYEHHPYLELELVEALWHMGARVLGVDTLSPDPTTPGALSAPVHEFWLGNDGVIVENLTGLQQLPERVEMTILPLPLAGLDGSPVRAIASYP